ncbi:hypothetical protein [Amycolatopsis aidingensis]|uniref:hypothetical protein n=1 Tax=Amycolatopsis aidingensis TaxID=2842453 RepID=UPI001E4A0FEC
MAATKTEALRRPNLTKNTATVLHRLTSRDGAVTSAVLRETHVTGLQASFLSYLRTCRARW